MNNDHRRCHLGWADFGVCIRRLDSMGLVTVPGPKLPDEPTGVVTIQVVDKHTGAPMGQRRCVLDRVKRRWTIERTEGKGAAMVVSAEALELAALCDGERTMEDLARAMGKPIDEVRWRVKQARFLTGDPMPVARSRPRKTTEFAEKYDEPAPARDEKPEPAGCARCGLRGEHECVPPLDHYAASSAGSAWDEA